MQSSSGAKNPPWARSNVHTNMSGINPQIMDPNAMISQQGMMSFQQTPTVFNAGLMQTQAGMPMSMGGQLQMNQMTQGQIYPANVVAYPTPRALNPGIFQNTPANQQNANTEQRVFTGTVTKTHNDFGFVDHDVFYQTSVCAKGVIPKINDRVLVEATFNPNMPFKWNATRVQVLNNSKQNSHQPKTNSYNAVPPPVPKKPMPSRREERSPRRDDRPKPVLRQRSRSRDRRDVRDNRDSRPRRDSPPRKRAAIVHQPSPVKQNVRVPKILLEVPKLDTFTLTQRYTNSLYIPSDFFAAYVKWGETFPPNNPFSISSPCAYHIMSKEAENPVENDAVLEPPDADYRFVAKVMLISLPSMEELYQKCGLTKGDDKEKNSSGNKTPQHPTRLIKFLVGQRGKGGENFAIGGPWSPSLDGENPQTDPKVLIKTAIRTCKSHTGIDLSSCTQWYRMVEYYYWREGGSRLECVVLFLPDVWSVQRSRIDWPAVQEQYKAACDAALARIDGKLSSFLRETPAAADESKIDIVDTNDGDTITIDDNAYEPKLTEPTPYSKIDLKTINMEQIRQELRARKVSFAKGTRAQLLARLSKLMKAEEDKEVKGVDIMELEDDESEEYDAASKEESTPREKLDTSEDTKQEPPLEPKVEKKRTEKEIEEEKRKLEKEKLLVKPRFEIPSVPHIIVHPSPIAKTGKFSCTVATLSLLLDYRISDNKEHSFEIFVFAEIFNEMLMRDFGFYIYKTLYSLPEKPEEAKDVKSAETTEKKEDKDKKDEKKDTRKRERKDSPSDDEDGGSKKRGGVDLPTDPFLMLALAYFDTSRGGSMTRKDLQNLFLSLSLQLSRSQIRVILDKVCVKDVFNYKSLMKAVKELPLSDTLQDFSLDKTDENKIDSEVVEVVLAGNRDLLPIFKTPTGDERSFSTATVDISETGLVLYKSRVVDVGALVAAEAKHAGVRARLEQALRTAQAALMAARRTAASTQQAEKGAKDRLNDLSASLATARARITSLTASSRIFHTALKSIQSKVEAVINIKYEDDDVVEIVNVPAICEYSKNSKKNEDTAIKENNKTRNKTVPQKVASGNVNVINVENEPKAVDIKTEQAETEKECSILEDENIIIENKVKENIADYVVLKEVDAKIDEIEKDGDISDKGDIEVIPQASEIENNKNVTTIETTDKKCKDEIKDNTSSENMEFDDKE